jgi:hypothetical protein
VKLYVDDAGSESARPLVGDATIGRPSRVERASV